MGKQFNTCEHCGAALDCGEKCDCKDSSLYTYSRDMVGHNEMRSEPMNPRTVYILCDADKRNKLIAKYGEKNIRGLDIMIGIEKAAPAPTGTAKRWR